MPPVTLHAIREDVLRDSRYPVHKIADQLLPYLHALVDKFRPHQVILFGSFAYGQPNRDSDVDLLVIKDIDASCVKDSVEILKVWRPLRWHGKSLPIELRVESVEDFEARRRSQGSFYAEVARQGLRLV